MLSGAGETEALQRLVDAAMAAQPSFMLGAAHAGANKERLRALRPKDLLSLAAACGVTIETKEKAELEQRAEAACATRARARVLSAGERDGGAV